MEGSDVVEKYGGYVDVENMEEARRGGEGMLETEQFKKSLHSILQNKCAFIW
jgi:hypothetical protein